MYFSFALIINLSWIFSITKDLFYVSPRKQLNSCVRIANFVTHNSKIIKLFIAVLFSFEIADDVRNCFRQCGDKFEIRSQTVK